MCLSGLCSLTRGSNAEALGPQTKDSGFSRDLRVMHDSFIPNPLKEKTQKRSQNSSQILCSDNSQAHSECSLNAH